MPQRKAATNPSPLRRSARLQKLSPLVECSNTNTPKKSPTKRRASMLSKSKQSDNNEQDQSENIIAETPLKQNGEKSDAKEAVNSDETKHCNDISLDSSCNIENAINIEEIKRKLNEILKSNDKFKVYRVNKMLEEVRRKHFDLKIDEILATLENCSSTDSESESNPFIDAMAEEGEEDTPSEDSCDIPVHGEEINTTESELSSDASYDNDSFIDDEEKFELLSGEEFDLSYDNNTKKRKSRILRLSIGSDEDIVKVKPKEKKITRKKSRIIKNLMDSSDEEDVKDKTDCNENFADSKSVQNQTLEKKNEDNESNTENQSSHIEDELKEKKLVEIDKERLTSNGEKIIILENIKVEDIENKDLSDNIKNLITSFCSDLSSQHDKKKKKRRRKLKKKKKTVFDTDTNKIVTREDSESKKNSAQISPYPIETKTIRLNKSKKKKRKRSESTFGDFADFFLKKKRKIHRDNFNKIVPDAGSIESYKRKNGHKLDWVINEITLKPSGILL